MLDNGVKLSVWAKQMGLSYRGAYRLFRANQLPCPHLHLATGTIIVFPETRAQGDTVVYCRVSSHDQKEDLQRQLERLRTFCAAKGWPVSKEVQEIGSGLNEKRKALLSLLSDPGVTRIVVEHPDRLARFGVEYVKAALLPRGVEIVVLNETAQDMDLVQDFVDVVTCMCARIYGRRSARNRAQKALEATR